MGISYVLATRRNKDGSDKVYTLMIYDSGRWDGVTYSAEALENLFLEIKSGKEKPISQPTPLPPRFTTIASDIVVDGKIDEKAPLEDILKFERILLNGS